MTKTPSPSDATILEISATGEIAVAPDLATISFSVETQSHEASDALHANAGKLETIVAALGTMGVAARDIQTSRINLAPQYVHRDGKPPRFESYQASSEIRVKVQDMTMPGRIIDGVVSAGATTVQHVALDLADRTAAEQAAQRAAIAALHAKAALFAEAAGLKISRLLRFSDSRADHEGGPAVRYALHAATPILPGEIVVRAEVHGTYALVR